jgi:glycosyltransferase involved in cell wall biosynthesis
MAPSVCHVLPYYDPHVGGVESHAEAIAGELVGRGRDVTVVTSQVEGTETEEVRDGVPVLRAEQKANLFNTPVAPGIRGLVEEVDADVVHSHTPPPLAALAAARYAAASGTPHVLTYHCDPEISARGGNAMVEAWRRTLGRYTLNRAHRILATTRTYASTSRALWHRSNVDVVPNPVDVDRFHPDGPTEGAPIPDDLGDETVAVFVGRLAAHKGTESFVRAAAQTDEDTVHLVVGDGPRRERLESLAGSVSGGHKVRFAGYVPDEDLPATYRRADLGVLPSTSRLEAFGIASLECMASGRPVVVSDIPGVREVVEEGETALLADPFDPQDLARRIDELGTDPKRRRAMGEQARAHVVENFGVEQVVDDLEDVYAELA